MKIRSIFPAVGLPGGSLKVRLEGAGSPVGLEAEIGGVPAEIVGASTESVTLRIPESFRGELVLTCGGERAEASFTLGRPIADELHPVSNPVIDKQGNVYVTYSGTRGESVPFGIFVISPDGGRNPFLGDITNPTGLAIGPDGCLYISSRHTGAIYRSSFDKQLEKFVEGLGIASGLAFDSSGNLYVGDRSGIIYRVRPDRDVTLFCELEPSVSAYHLVVDSSDFLYVTGPTLATQDSIYRISPSAEVDIYFRGFGRPQGLAFDPAGRLQVAGSYRGQKGIYSIVDGKPELLASGPMLVGLAYDSSGKILYAVDNERLYRIDL